MQDDYLTFFEVSQALLTYIDTAYVFDKAAAGGCSGMDYHQSDTFYDLIVNARKAVSEVQNGLDASHADNEMRNGYAKLFGVVKALVNHIQKEPAFDKVNDMGPVGIETYQSEAFIEVIQTVNKAMQHIENRLL